MSTKPPKSVANAILDAAIGIVAEVVSSTVAGATPLRAKDRDRVRRVTRRGIRSAAQTAAKTAAAKMRARTEKKPQPKHEPIALKRLQVVTACRVLAMEPPDEGKPVNLDTARTNKRAAAKLFHPDVAAGKRDQFELVMNAYELLESYNESLVKK